MRWAPCQKCRGLSLSIYSQADVKPLAWHANSEDLFKSAHECPICQAIWDLTVVWRARQYFGSYPDLPPDASFGLKVSVSNRRWTGQTLWCCFRVDLSYPGIKVTSGELNLLAISQDEDSIDWWTRSACALGNTASDRISAINHWMQDCVANHPECAPPLTSRQSLGTLPARLLDVSPGKTPRLVLTGSLSCEEQCAVTFATLSYCWGKALPIRTTTKSEAEFIQGIPEANLPRTFRDAIRIVRALSIRYLWIDALCIVQDDKDDWQRESAKMAHIYHNSLITIAACDAKDSNGGCLPPDDVDPAVASPESLEEVDEGTLRIMPRVYSFSEEDSPRTTFIRFERGMPWFFQRARHLSTRGWTFQEQIRSHRIVHCAQLGMHWQCRRKYKTQAGFEDTGRQAGRASRSILVPEGQQTNWLWCDWVDDYTLRGFTYASDRLPAFLGIVEHYQSLTGHTPLLGLWRETFARDLLWTRIGLAQGPKMEDLPSWTWLSRYVHVEIDYWEVLGAVLKEDLALVACEVLWKGVPFLSALASARLVIRAPVMNLRLRVTPESGKFHLPFFLLEGQDIDMNNVVPWTFAGQFDDEHWPAENFDEYTCALCRTRLGEKDGSELFSQAFVMLRSVPGTQKYRRVGVGRVNEKKPFFAGAETREMEIV